MACLELICNACEHTWFSNTRDNCPKCGCDDVHAFFDESSDDDQPDDHEEEENE